MYGSDRFRKEIRRSHEVVAYVDATSPTNEPIRLRVVSGSVTVDRSATVRRTCNVSCIDPTGNLTPEGPESSVTPFGTELRPFRGVRYADGSVEIIPLGVFCVTRVRVSASPDGVKLDIEASDRSWKISRDKFIDPYIIAEDSNVVAAIMSLVERTFPEVQYDVVTNEATTPTTLMYKPNDDPWKVIKELATSIGCDAFFDREGRFALAPLSHSSVVFSYETNQANTVLSIGTEFSAVPGYNGVIVENNNLGSEVPPIRVTVWDENPSSPTYHYGPYGEVPYYHSDNIVQTEGEAMVVGQQILRSFLGVSASLSVSAVVNPDLEGGDAVEVYDSLTKVSGRYTVEAFDVPLMASESQELELIEENDV